MKKILVFACGLFMLFACNSATDSKTEANEATTAAADSATAAAPAGSIVLPPSSTDVVKKSIESYAAGDIAGFTAAMDDNIKLYYPGPGDSLVGKQAVADFFTKRRAVADSIQVVDPIYLGVRNNTNEAAQKGDWLMAWYSFAIKYKTGKKVFLPVHVVQHMNDAGKADFMVMYYDMARVAQASK